jgi:carbon starvation protein
MAFTIAASLVAYAVYGGWLARTLGVDDARATPAHTAADGVDFVASPRPVVLGHHFASIAGAGPIVGPIIAISFGWLPTLAWILVGVIFLGGVHDFTTLVASVRHSGRTISDIVEDYVGLPAKRLFIVFGIAALVLVVGVFTDIVATTFAARPEVATTSAAFIALAVAFGWAVRRLALPLLPATILGVVGLAGAVALGHALPLSLPYTTWVLIALVYVAIAAIAPVWILLQPRDYLNSFLLYGVLGAGVLGLFVARPTLSFDPFVGLHHDKLGFLFPILFVTVACGAISGFHSLVASGTTSKQLDRESDARFVGYGGMLLEGVLAVLALIAAGVMTTGEHAAALAGAGPIAIFSTGVGSFMAAIGIPTPAAESFVALAVSAFALTSLDTCTRLGRLLFGELFTSKETRDGGAPPALALLFGDRMTGTLAMVALGGGLTLSGQFTAIWPVFGAANQLLAALALLSVTAWLAHRGTRVAFVAVPMVFMFTVTVAALGQLIWRNLFGATPNIVLGGVATLLLALALVLLALGIGALSRRGANARPLSSTVARS